MHGRPIFFVLPGTITLIYVYVYVYNLNLKQCILVLRCVSYS